MGRCGLAVLFVGVLAGCFSSPAGESVTQVTSAVSVPPLSQFLVLARRGASFRDRATASGGSIGVSAGVGVPPNTFSVGFDGRVAIGRVIVAPRVVLQARTVVGAIDANQISAAGATTGVRAPFQPPPPAPMPGPVAAGTTPVNVPAGQSVTIVAGKYGAIDVAGTLTLAGGIYQIASLRLDNDARLVASSSAVVRVAGGITGLDRVRLLPLAPLRARDLRLEVAGSADGGGISVRLGNDAQLKALVVAQLAIQAGDRFVAAGALSAQDVSIGHDALLTFDGGFGCASGAECAAGACVAGSCVDSADIACQASQVVRLPLDPGQPFDLASDGTSIYWTDTAAGAVRRAAINGSGPTSLVTGRPGVGGLAVDDTFVYLADVLEQSISRVPKSGGTPEIIAFQQRAPRFLVNDGDHLLWTNQGTGHGDGSVRQYTKSAGRLDSLADGQQGPWVIASVNGRAYWSDAVAGTVFSRGALGDPIETTASGLRTPALAAGSGPHLLSADGRLYDFDTSSKNLAARGISPPGAFFLAARDPSVFWTNGVQKTLIGQGSEGAYPSTVWKRPGGNTPRVVRAFSGAVFFSVASQPGSGSIFSFVADTPPEVITGAPACPAGASGPACDHTAAAVIPLLECVFETSDHRLIAHFGYRNADRLTRRVGVGPENQVDRGDGDGCQPTTFASGTRHDVFAVGFVDEITWLVGQRSATASRSSTRCAPGAVRATEVSP